MKFTLNFWSKENGQRIERVYANNEAGECLGFWEQRTSLTERLPLSYYDRHRIAKGDDQIYTRHDATFVAKSDVTEAALLAAVGVGEREIEQANADCGGGLFKAIARKARNGHATWYGNTPKADVARLKKSRDTAVYELI